MATEILTETVLEEAWDEFHDGAFSFLNHEEMGGDLRSVW
jgi:hypothetical protein